MLTVLWQLGGQHLGHSWAVQAVTEKLSDHFPQVGTRTGEKHWTGSQESRFLKPALLLNLWPWVRHVTESDRKFKWKKVEVLYRTDQMVSSRRNLESSRECCAILKQLIHFYVFLSRPRVRKLWRVGQMQLPSWFCSELIMLLHFLFVGVEKQKDIILWSMTVM